MAGDVFIRPEVRLNDCPDDGGNLIRQYAEDGIVFKCASCGHCVIEDLLDLRQLRTLPQAA